LPSFPRDFEETDRMARRSASARIGATMVDPRSLRLAALLLILGEVIFIGAGLLHPAREPANSHAAVFTEYAESANWTAVHLGQFVGAAIIIAGLIAIFFAVNVQASGGLELT